MPIRLLDSQVSSSIAAGEVIERPASVVKELVENSIDAGATEVFIAVRNGGTELIQVIDNGVGIHSEEAQLAFESHATSKIRNIDDLKLITSMGFRGEALSSILAVSRTSMLTRSSDEYIGTHLVLEGGHMQSTKQSTRSPGTTVRVEDLFGSLPARRKFLRSSAAELEQINNVVKSVILAFPGVKVSFSAEGRTILQSSGSGDERDALASVYGIDVASSMIALESEQFDPDHNIKVSGFVSPPLLTRSNRRHIRLFVNRRWVNNPPLVYALEESYKGFLQEHRHPLAVLHVQISPADLDINVHPAKSQVRFHAEREVFAAVQKAVRTVLSQGSPIPQIQPSQRERVVSSWRPYQPEYAMPLIPDDETVSRVPYIRPNMTISGVLPLLRIVGQVEGTYVLAEGPDGLYIIDQHAAHERVLLERIMAQLDGSTVDYQYLLDPIPLELNGEQQEILGQGQDTLRKFGFHVESFGYGKVLMRAVPAALMERKRDLNTSLGDVLGVLANSNNVSDGLTTVAVSIACHSAVRAGDVLSHAEMTALVRDLEVVNNPNTCPHGRPTIIHFSSAHLEREFGRR